MKTKETRIIILITAILLFLILSVSLFFVIKPFFDSKLKKETKSYSEALADPEGKTCRVKTCLRAISSEKEITKSDMQKAKSVLETRLVSQGATDYEIECDFENKEFAIEFCLFSTLSSDHFVKEKGLEIVKFISTNTKIVFREGNGDSNGRVILSGDADIKRAEPGISPETAENIVNLTFTKQGTEKFKVATSELIGKYISIFLESIKVDPENYNESTECILLSAPMVQETIDNGECFISGGNMTAETATSLAEKINCGELPFLLVVDESKTKTTLSY